MNIIFKPLYQLFGYCMSFLMGLLSDQYFLAIIIFVVLTRLILLPFNIKQQKTMAKTSRIQPKIAKIQKKYANTGNLSQKQMADNRQKMNEEMQALYTRENHNPMNMGCGPMLFQMVFLFGIIGIIYYPLQYVIRITPSELEILTAAAKKFMEGKVTYPELTILSKFNEIKAVVGDKISAETMAHIGTYAKGMTIGNFDLTQFPKLKLEPLVLVPVGSFITSFLSSLYSTMAQKKNNPAMEQNGQMTMMMLMMPFFSLYIAFKVPAAVGIYWIISNVVTTIQQIVLNQLYPTKKITAMSMIEGTIERRSKEKSIINSKTK